MRVLAVAEAGVVLVLLVVMVWQFRRQRARVDVRPDPDVGLRLILEGPDRVDAAVADEAPVAPAPAPAVVTAPEYEVPRALVPVEPAPVDDQAVATRETWATPTALIGTRRVHRSCAEARRDGRVERVCALCVPVLTGGGRG